MKKRCVSIILILAILSSFIVIPTSAASDDGPMLGIQGSAKDIINVVPAADYWQARFESFCDGASIGRFGIASKAYFTDYCWQAMSYALIQYGRFESLSALKQQATLVKNRLVYFFKNGDSFLTELGVPDINRKPFVSAMVSGFAASVLPSEVTVEQFAGYGWCISDGKGNLLCRDGGQICYFVEDNKEGESTVAENLGGKWVDAAFRGGVPGLHLYSYRSTLETVADRLCDLGETCGVQSWTYKNEKYWYILKERGSSVYADKQGRPYVVRQSSDYAVDKNQNYYAPGKDSGNTFNQQLVDLLTGVLNAPRGDSVTQGDNSLYLEDGAIYNPDNRTYSFTATNSFNTTTNNYYTYNYSYTYHINYTSVTYIGTTAQYDEIYKYYYELPDGRSSADLTADELLALNTEVDVVPYTRSTDNTALRSLYHLDGNVKDSSYWNYLTSWEWVKGASITYMESPSPFGGYLYLDETEHEWNLNLPSGLGSQDFTLQFRLYQKATVTPQADSYIAFGTNQVLKFDGGDFTFNGTAHLMPVGTWNEFALIRDSGVLRLYLNGVIVDSYSNFASFPKTITFHFGSAQKTTKGLDELRVLNYALQKGGQNFQAATAPYDTNLSLVLPDSTTPVADEYWKFDQTITPKVSWNFGETPIVSRDVYSTGSDAGSPWFCSSAFTSVSDLLFSSLSLDSAPLVFLSSSPDDNGGAPTVYYYCDPSLLSRRFPTISRVSTESPFDIIRYSPESAIKFPLGMSVESARNQYSVSYFNNFSASDLGSTFTFSLLFADGSVSSLTFSFYIPKILDRDYPQEHCIFVSKSFDWGTLYFVGSDSGISGPLDYYLFGQILVAPNEGQTLDIVYAEIVPGSTPNTGHEFVSTVAPVNTDFKTPTLAVRTDQTITGYQIGGVRPSLPEKGLVYALVEDSRITSLQIYNGSMWEKVDGRIWTGSRWVPYYAYNIILFKDLWDIVEADPSQEYIYTESGFWSWLQKAWAQMITLLTDIRDRITGGSGGSGVDSSVVGPDSSTLPPVTDDGGSGWSFIDLASVLVKSGWKICTGTVTLVFGGLSGMTDAVTNLADGFKGFDFMGRYDGTISEFSGVLDYAESSADSSG